ncbi:MAG: NADH-quinone oxidoreductase subunit L [Sulfolobales archaeon]
MGVQIIWWIDLIWVIPFLGAALAGLVGLLKKRLSGFVGVISIAISAILTIPLLAIIWSDPSTVIISRDSVWFTIPISRETSVVFRFVSYADGLSSIMALMVAWISLLIAIYSLRYMENDYGEHRYWVFFTFFVGSMLLLVLAGDILLFIIGWEGTSLASYALIGHWYRDDDELTYVGDKGRSALGKSMFFSPSHSAVRAIVMTGAADIGLLLGLGFIIVSAKTSFIPDLYASSALANVFEVLSSYGVLTLFLFITSLGALAKSAQFPLHEWLVTAMTGPASVSALIHAATMVKAGVYFMLRFSPIFISVASLGGEQVLYQVREYFIIIASLGAFTAFMMATMAVVARELKLIWAFSTASQIGYMFVAAASSGLISEQGLGIVAGFSHLLSHAVFKAALFLSAGALIHAVHSRYINDMKNLASYMKITTFSSYLAALSLASVPPLAGFWSKDLVIEVSALTGLSVIPALLLITAFLTSFYSMRAVSYLFMRSSSEKQHIHEASSVMYIPYLILAIASVLMGFFWMFSYGDFAHVILATLPIKGVEEIHFEVELMIISLIIALVAVLFAVSVYQFMKKEIYPRISGVPLIKALHNFLYDRWDINSVLYIIFVDGFSSLINYVGRYFEDLAVDGFYHRYLVALADRLSKALRSIQFGFINIYLVALLIGFLVLLLLGVWVR